jgi:hypothetical protein
LPNNRQFQPIWVTTGDPVSVNEVTPYAVGQLGAEVTVKNTSSFGVGSIAGQVTQPDAGRGGKTFKFVQVDSTATVAPFQGAVAWWSDADNFKVTTAATNRGQVAGVFCSPFPQLGNYGFIQIQGPAFVKFVDAPTANPTAAGLIVIPSATAAKADCLASGSAATFPVLGRSNGVYNVTTTLGEVMLQTQQVP